MSRSFGSGLRMVGFLFVTIFVPRCCFASSASITVGGGTLFYTETTSTHTCYIGNAPATYTQFSFTNFSYTDQNGVSWSGASSGGVYILSSPGGFCPPKGPLPSDTVAVVNGTGFTINFHPCPGTTCSANIIYPGYINPKYVILGITYAPPGPQSFVDYTNSTLLGSTVSVSNSFSSGITNTIKVSRSISGWFSGSVSASASTTYTQESDYGTTVTVNKQTSTSDKTPGPSDPYIGINHDYDVIWLWLNPVALFTVFPDTNMVEWDGYGFSTADQPAMDIYPVFVGWLNGDIPMTASQAAPLNRTWAAGQTWPAGQGPELTSTDFQNILAADPYWQCAPNPAACPRSVDPGRYTLVTANQDFIYQQAPLGGQPLTQTYSETYTSTTSTNQGYKYTYSQTYGLEQTFSGGIFGIKFGATLSKSSTFTSSYQYSKQMTIGTSSAASLSITGPPCVVSGSTCNPVYTRSTQFDLYQDVLYGTFLLNPVN
jgi:hypothetical protein